MSKAEKAIKEFIEFIINRDNSARKSIENGDLEKSNLYPVKLEMVCMIENDNYLLGFLDSLLKKHGVKIGEDA